MSTGFDALDTVLGGLYWGDNVVWQFDRATRTPFFRAIASQDDAFDTKTVISLGGPAEIGDVPGLGLINAGSGSDLAQPAGLLLEIHRLCHPNARRLLLFDSLDRMVRNWGVNGGADSSLAVAPFCSRWERSRTGQ
ncbi:MAG: hypothetical protein ACTHQQ_15825 [Solirubrobacteraceae bacterium]